MKQAMTAEEKYKMMMDTPINRLIPRLAVPTIISMLITSIYNMADTFFVSQLSTSASGAVGVNFSLMAMIQAIGFTLGMGSGNYMSRMLGAKESEKAQRACSTSVYTALVFGLLLAVFGILNIDALVSALGATKTIAPYAKDYGKYILLAAPYMTVSFVFNNQLRSQGNAMLSMIGITAGGILNVILDPILIFRLHMGISGAAVATIFSQFISFLILLVLVLRSENVIKPRPGFFTMRGWVYKEILSAGLPTLGRQGLASAASVLLNVAASGFGDAAVAAMSIVTRIMMFINSALIGFGQGFQPVCGFNYGAKLYHRVREGFVFCVKYATIFLIGISVIGVVFAPDIIALFRKEDQEVIAVGAVALRMQCIVFPLTGWIVMSNMMLQSIGKALKASILAAARQGLFFIPLILILPRMFGLLGVEICQTVSDIFSFALAVPLCISVINEMKRQEYNQKQANG